MGVAARSLLKRRNDGPAVCLLFGGLLAFCSLALGPALDSLDIPAPDELIKIEGCVQNVAHTRRPTAVHIYVTSQTRPYHITQRAFPGLSPTIDGLRAGDNVVAMVKHDFLSRDLNWLWALRRDNQVLLTYEHVLAMHHRDRERLLPAAWGTAGLSLVFFTLGFVLRKRWGAWYGIA